MKVDPLSQKSRSKYPRPSREPTLAAILNPFGRFGIRLNNTLGAMAIFLGRAVIQIFHYKQIPEIINQVYFIGAKSASIVALVGFFTGMVIGLQLYYVMNKFGAVGFLGTAVALSLIRELGPVLTAIMITARAGSAMTAEIGIQPLHVGVYSYRIDDSLECGWMFAGGSSSRLCSPYW